MNNDDDKDMGMYMYKKDNLNNHHTTDSHNIYPYNDDDVYKYSLIYVKKLTMLTSIYKEKKNIY